MCSFHACYHGGVRFYVQKHKKDEMSIALNHGSSLIFRVENSNILTTSGCNESPCHIRPIDSPGLRSLLLPLMEH